MRFTLAPLKFGPETIDAQFLVLITCRDEKHQVELLKRFGKEGLGCKAILAWCDTMPQKQTKSGSYCGSFGNGRQALQINIPEYFFQ